MSIFVMYMFISGFLVPLLIAWIAFNFAYIKKMSVKCERLSNKINDLETAEIQRIMDGKEQEDEENI